MKRRDIQEWQRWCETMSQGENPEAWRGITCFLRWFQTREEQGHPVPAFMQGLEEEIEHSRLLRRLLEGREPLLYPPPESFGQAWYELMESGNGIATEVHYWEWSPERKIAINEDIWTILEKRSETELVVTYRPEGEAFLLNQITENLWSLERVEHFQKPGSSSDTQLDDHLPTKSLPNP